MSTQRSSSQYLSNTLQYIPKIPYILSQVVLSDYHAPSPSSFFQVGRYHAVQLRCRMPALLYLGCGKIQKKGTGTTSLLPKNPIMSSAGEEKTNRPKCSEFMFLSRQWSIDQQDPALPSVPAPTWTISFLWPWFFCPSFSVAVWSSTHSFLVQNSGECVDRPSKFPSCHPLVPLESCSQEASKKKSTAPSWETPVTRDVMQKHRVQRMSMALLGSATGAARSWSFLLNWRTGPPFCMQSIAMWPSR